MKGYSDSMFDSIELWAPSSLIHSLRTSSDVANIVDGEEDEAYVKDGDECPSEEVSGSFELKEISSADSIEGDGVVEEEFDIADVAKG